MTGTRRDHLTGKSFAAPVVGIFALLSAYWLIADWNALPKLLTATFQ